VRVEAGSPAVEDAGSEGPPRPVLWLAAPRRVLILLAGAVLALACDRTRDCPPETKCPAGKTCRCDGAGRVARVEHRAGNSVEILRYSYDEAGRMIKSEADVGDDGSVEREVTYAYDAEGRRVGMRGWNRNCQGGVGRWECVHDEPCPAPYDRCKPCRNPEDAARRKSLEPCEDPPAKE
jgi:YD repeat-containing protein